MSGEDPKNGGPPADKFVWLAASSWARNGRRLTQGALHRTENFKPDTIAEWIRTGAARWPTAEDRDLKDGEHIALNFHDADEPASAEEIYNAGGFWPLSYYHDGEAAAMQPSLFPGVDLPGGEELQRLQSKLGHAGYPRHILQTPLKEKELKRLLMEDFEASSDFVPILHEVVKEIVSSGDPKPGRKRTTRIKWFWFANVLNHIVFYESRFELAAAGGGEEGGEKRNKIYLDGVRKAADLFGIVLPSIAEEWKGEKSFSAIIKRPDFKMDARMFRLIADQTPLRADGFTAIEEKGKTVWRAQFGRRQVELTMPKIYPGDIARRTILSVSKIAQARETLSPGPIEFGEILEIIGETACNQETRERIREHLIALENAGVKVTEKNERGKEIYHDSAPLLNRCLWDGGTELSAKFYPVFNEAFDKALKALGQYVYITSERLRGLPAGPEWDRFVLDFFRLQMGKRHVRRKMKAFLFEDVRANEETLKAWGTSEIKKRVKAWFELAKAEGLIRGYHISDTGKLKGYLGQTIIYYPSKNVWKRPKIHADTAQALIDDIITWIYDPDNKQTVEMHPHDARRELKNAIYTIGDVALVRQIWEGLLEYREGAKWEPTGEELNDGRAEVQSVYMEFWDRLRTALAEAKKKKDGGK